LDRVVPECHNAKKDIVLFPFLQDLHLDLSVALVFDALFEILICVNFVDDLEPHGFPSFRQKLLAVFLKIESAVFVEVVEGVVDLFNENLRAKFLHFSVFFC
jgi:hypothetical protein